MPLPLQPLQPSINRGKRRKRRMSNKSFLLLVVATLLHLSVVVVNGQESSSSPPFLDTTVHSSSTNALLNRRLVEETSEEMMGQVKAKRRSSSSSSKKKKHQQSSSSEEDAKAKQQRQSEKGSNNMDMTALIENPTTDDASSNNDKSFNVTAISLTTCVKIEYAVSYLTRLDWKDIDITSAAAAATSENQQNDDGTWSDVYLMQLIVLPASLTMVLFGSQLLLPVCTMTAAGLGVFCIFHFVNHYFQNGLDCPMKLALSGVSATLAAMGAAAFVRFGLFTLGTVSAGGLSYLLFDAFPELDPGLNATITNDATARVAEALESDLSPHAWVITILLALAGGLFLRLYEQASLEVLTAILGGVGVSYSAHAFFLSRHVDLDRSVVFLIATTVAFIGWRFQRNRRLRLIHGGNPYHEYKGHLPVHAPPPPPPAAAAAAAAPAPTMQPIASPVDSNPNLSLSNWNQLQYSLYSTNNLLQQQRQSNNPAASNSNEMEAMAEELTNLLNSFQERVQERERSKRR